MVLCVLTSQCADRRGRGGVGCRCGAGNWWGAGREGRGGGGREGARSEGGRWEGVKVACRQKANVLRSQISHTLVLVRALFSFSYVRLRSIVPPYRLVCSFSSPFSIALSISSWKRRKSCGNAMTSRGRAARQNRSQRSMRST